MNEYVISIDYILFFEEHFKFVGEELSTEFRIAVSLILAIIEANLKIILKLFASLSCCAGITPIQTLVHVSISLLLLKLFLRSSQESIIAFLRETLVTATRNTTYVSWFAIFLIVIVIKLTGAKAISLAINYWIKLEKMDVLIEKMIIPLMQHAHIRVAVLCFS